MFNSSSKFGSKLSKFDITSNVKSHWVLEKALYKQNIFLLMID